MPSDRQWPAQRVAFRLVAALALGCGATVIPQQMALSFADHAFDDMDRFRDERDAVMLRATMKQLIAVAQQMM